MRTSLKKVFCLESALKNCAHFSGADLVGGAEIVSRVAAGDIDFDKCVATPGMMSRLRTIARVLGPRGLMPSPKLGTLVEGVAITKAVGEMKGGRVEYRCASARDFLVERAQFHLDWQVTTCIQRNCVCAALLLTCLSMWKIS